MHENKIKVNDSYGITITGEKRKIVTIRVPYSKIREYQVMNDMLSSRDHDQYQYKELHFNEKKPIKQILIHRQHQLLNLNLSNLNVIESYEHTKGERINTIKEINRTSTLTITKCDNIKSILLPTNRSFNNIIIHQCPSLQQIIGINNHNVQKIRMDYQAYQVIKDIPLNESIEVLVSI
jgi:hypothetical protein